jgi:hypothetical protein
LRLARLRRRIKRTAALIDREREVHRDLLVVLRRELDELQFAELTLNRAAADYQVALERRRIGLPDNIQGGPLE